MEREFKILRSMKEYFDHSMASIKRGDRDFVEYHICCLSMHFNYEFRFAIVLYQL